MLEMRVSDSYITAVFFFQNEALRLSSASCQTDVSQREIYNFSNLPTRRTRNPLHSDTVFKQLAEGLIPDSLTIGGSRCLLLSNELRFLRGNVLV